MLRSYHWSVDAPLLNVEIPPCKRSAWLFRSLYQSSYLYRLQISNPWSIFWGEGLATKLRFYPQQEPPQAATEPQQPIHGFTISASEKTEEVQMLRSAWEAGDAAARAIIRKMAELSISRGEGIPTRQYTP